MEGVQIETKLVKKKQLLMGKNMLSINLQIHIKFFIFNNHFYYEDLPPSCCNIIRCILAGFHVLAAYFALQQMPLSVRVMILSLKPVFTIIFERIFLKVPVGVIEVKPNAG